MAALEDLEARVAALEACQADYRAVLTSVNALGANQRDYAIGLAAVENKLTTVENKLDDHVQQTRAGFRSVDEQLAEIKDLIVGQRDGRDQ